MWTPVVDDKLTCIAFPNTRRNFATSIRVPASSILASFSLGASYTWPQIFEWADVDTIRGWILFNVRVLFEEIRYVSPRHLAIA